MCDLAVGQKTGSDTAVEWITFMDVFDCITPMLFKCLLQDENYILKTELLRYEFLRFRILID